MNDSDLQSQVSAMAEIKAEELRRVDVLGLNRMKLNTKKFKK